MKQKTQTQTALFVAITAMLISIGVPVADNMTIGDAAQELDGKYACGLTGQILPFDRLSGSLYTGYPFEDSNKGYKRCGSTDNKGEWMDIISYAESIGMDPYDLLVDQPETVPKQLPGIKFKVKQGQEPTLVE